AASRASKGWKRRSSSASSTSRASLRNRTRQAAASASASASGSVAAAPAALAACSASKRATSAGTVAASSACSRGASRPSMSASTAARRAPSPPSPRTRSRSPPRSRPVAACISRCRRRPWRCTASVGVPRRPPAPDARVQSPPSPAMAASSDARTRRHSSARSAPAGTGPVASFAAASSPPSSARDNATARGQSSQPPSRSAGGIPAGTEARPAIRASSLARAAPGTGAQGGAWGMGRTGKTAILARAQVAAGLRRGSPVHAATTPATAKKRNADCKSMWLVPETEAPFLVQANPSRTEQERSSRMRKTPLITASILALALAGLSSSALAAEPTGFYAGAGVGQSFIDEPIADDEDFGFQVFGGYQFTPYVGLEAAYTDFGEVDLRGNA